MIPKPTTSVKCPHCDEVFPLPEPMLPVTAKFPIPEDIKRALYKSAALAVHHALSDVSGFLGLATNIMAAHMTGRPFTNMVDVAVSEMMNAKREGNPNDETESKPDPTV